jgi:transglutaminase-like putative cysteine protease
MARDELAAHRTTDTIEALEFVLPSPFVPTDSVLADYAHASFPPDAPLDAAVSDLSRRLHADFRYDPKATRIDTPLLEVFRSRCGVCQDFSHLMIGMLRSLGLAARYVSGYLRSGDTYTGAEASHAWVSVLAPGSGWIDIDPTNDVRPGTGHLTLAWGRDYGDVVPVKGVALGGGAHAVEVEVRMEPVAEES